MEDLCALALDRELALFFEESARTVERDSEIYLRSFKSLSSIVQCCKERKLQVVDEILIIP